LCNYINNNNNNEPLEKKAKINYNELFIIYMHAQQPKKLAINWRMPHGCINIVAGGLSSPHLSTLFISINRHQNHIEFL